MNEKILALNLDDIKDGNISQLKSNIKKNFSNY